MYSRKRRDSHEPKYKNYDSDDDNEIRSKIYRYEEDKTEITGKLYKRENSNEPRKRRAYYELFAKDPSEFKSRYSKESTREPTRGTTTRETTREKDSRRVKEYTSKHSSESNSSTSCYEDDISFSNSD